MCIRDRLYVGRAAEQTFQRFGVKTIGDLAAFDRQALFTLLGKHGVQLHDYACGLDRSPVSPAGQYTPPKSVGNGFTLDVYKRQVYLSPGPDAHLPAGLCTGPDPDQAHRGLQSLSLIHI